MIVEYQKNVGETMNQVISRFRSENPEVKKIAYAGRLDPLASGLILIFTDNDVYQCNNHVLKNKVYTFSVLHSISTDTYDIMGLTLNNQQDPQSIECKEYQGIKYPPFSSHNIKPYNEPLWKCIKEGLEIKNWPTHNIKVLDHKVTKEFEILGCDLLQDVIINSINKVTKMTYRQDEIIANWNKVINHEKQYKITQHEIILSSGGYVRHFANMLKGCAFDIKRIRYL
jgi:tRNA U55 pseudouridine synthase TruB